MSALHPVGGYQQVAVLALIRNVVAVRLGSRHLVPQGGSQKSLIQKSKVLWNKLFKAFQWSAYFRRPVLVVIKCDGYARRRHR
ncbi:hypothetical protein [Nostoc sp.]|uniref:hypothetical protein n=1 Tax=Nostoc sp. TaxID=1180 RepID=UPI002FF776FB